MHSIHPKDMTDGRKEGYVRSTSGRRLETSLASSFESGDQSCQQMGVVKFVFVQKGFLMSFYKKNWDLNY